MDNWKLIRRNNFCGICHKTYANKMPSKNYHVTAVVTIIRNRKLLNTNCQENSYDLMALKHVYANPC